MYSLTSNEQAILDKAKAIAEENIAPHAASVDKYGLFPSESIAALGREGFLGLTISQDFGGMGQRLRVACAILDEISQRCASTGMIYLMHLAGIACYSAAPERTAPHLVAAAKGDHLSTLAWSERGSRSQFWMPVSQAVSENGHVNIKAEKSFVTSANHANGYVVSTKSPHAETATDTVLYLVLRGDGGVKITSDWDSLGMRGNASSPILLDGVILGPNRALCDDGQGLQIMLGVVLPLFQVGNAAISVGIAEAAVRATQRHLTGNRFEHLNTTLAEMPNLRCRLAQMRITTDMARAHLVSTIKAIENPGETTQLIVLGVKAAASDSAMAVTENAMRACGGAAFGKHLVIERLFRDARASAIMAPTTDHAHDFIGRALCGMQVF